MIKQIYTDIELPTMRFCAEPTTTPLEKLKKEVAKKMRVAPYMLRLKTRKQDIVDARVEFTKRAIQEGFDPNLIIRSINRDRTTIYHYLNRTF